MARPVENVSMSFSLVCSSRPLCEFFSLDSSFLIKGDFSKLLPLQEISGSILDGHASLTAECAVGTRAIRYIEESFWLVSVYFPHLDVSSY